MRLRIHVIAEGSIAAEHNLELSGDMDLTTLKVLLEDESQIPMDEQMLARYAGVVAVGHLNGAQCGCADHGPV